MKTHICFVGYTNFFEWAEVQHKAGLRQSHCPYCCKWYFPQEECGHDKNERLTEKQLAKVSKEAAVIAEMMETNTGRRKLGMPPLLERNDFVPRFPGDKPPKDRGYKDEG